MPDSPTSTALVPRQRSIWLRALLMIVMAMAFQFTATVLGLMAVVQWVLALVGGGPNPRLAALGQALGRYLRQVADFVSFGSERAPFPFSDWPAS